MRVFVAGASGVLGRLVVRLLVDAGHDVTGLTSRRPEVVSELGAVPAVADAFDAGALRDAVVAAKPDAILNLLTRIPSTPYLTPSRLAQNDRVRIEGTRNLIEAANAAGVAKLISESVTFSFSGRSEDKMSPLVGMGRFSRSVEAVLSLEEQTRSYEGVVLRYSFFYGPGTVFEKEIPAALRRRMLPIVGQGTGWWSFIHVEDAASATVRALEKAPAGETFNVTDDEPILSRDALDMVADHFGAPRPWRLPGIGPPYLVGYFNHGTGASNAKLKGELGWAPKYPDLASGLGK